MPDMNSIDDHHLPSSEEGFAFQWGRFTKAVEQLREDFKELKFAVASRCTDCFAAKSARDHEKRLRWLEAKVIGISAGASVLISLAIKYLV